MRKQITLKQLFIKNFKGEDELVINFGNITDIYGDNGTGKTTIFDAVTYILFDKDSKDRKNFEIKTLDKNNEVIHGLEHQVTAILLVDGREISLSKIHKEKWTKKKGEADRTLTGNETLYYIDDIPVKQTEYQDKVNSLISENIFRLITSPSYFSQNMKWQDRRNIILEIIGDIAVDKILKNKVSLKALEKLLYDKDIDTLKRSIAARKKKLNEDIKAIPNRIDETHNFIQEHDFSAIEFELKQYKAYLKNTEEKLLDRSKISEELLQEKSRLYELKDKLMSIEVKANSEAKASLKGVYIELSSCEREKATLENRINKMDYQVHNKESQINDINKELEDLRIKYKEVQKDTLIISEDSSICPTCKRAFDAEANERRNLHLQENFNVNKSKLLAEINATGTAKRDVMEFIKREVESLFTEREVLNERLTELLRIKIEIQDSIDTFVPKVDFKVNEEYATIKNELTLLENKLARPIEVNGEVNQLKEQKSEFAKKIAECNKLLGVKEQNERFNLRIKELMEEERALAVQIAELEGQEFLCEEFIKTKVELLENSINKKFKFVKFKLFNTLINGGVEECCEALIDGVPFGNANTASQINAGIDIINALSDYYQVSAPIFIDNRESVNKIINCSSQIISLIVSHDKELRIESIESEVA